MWNQRLGMDSTCSAGTPLERELAEVLDAYLAQLERGETVDTAALLAAHPEIADELRLHLEDVQLLQGAAARMRFIQSAAEAPADPRQVGEYRILREIGRGGMGIVYEAHQHSLNRQVALKMLPFGAVLDPRKIARFRNEAQAAAQLHHPHIVPVFAVGQEQGVYYYAMQFIDGQSLSQIIDEMREHDVNLAERSTRGVTGVTRPMGRESAETLSRSRGADDFYRTVARLGRQAAEAIEHAHQFGIIHRDIKPSNLMIDNLGQLWITDFGLARMQSDVGVTRTGDLIGTLRYMSPEQASGQSALIDPRTDVYSLGVTLYELLAGEPAFGDDDRQTLLKRVIHDEPTPLRKLNRTVPVDLETIVMTAMAKSRDDRYSSAQALAEDLERFLADKPALARRPTVADRTARWARRHRPLVTVAAAALVCLTLVSAVGLGLLVREQARTKAALAQAELNALRARSSFERAEKHFRQARVVVDQFGAGLVDRLAEIPGAEPVRRQLLVDTLQYYRAFVAEAAGDPALRHDLAIAHFKSGVLVARLGAVADAVAEYQAAQQILSELAAANPTSAELESQLALAHNNLGLLLAARGDAPAARAEYEKAIRIKRRLADAHPMEGSYASQLAESQANLGMLLSELGEGPQAEVALRSAVENLRPLAERPDAEAKYVRNLAIASNNLSYVLRCEEPKAAERWVREAVTLLRELSTRYPAHTGYHDDLALCYNNLAAIALSQDRPLEAIPWHSQSISLQEQLVRKSPAVVRHRSELATSLNNLGVAYCRVDRAAEADEAFGRARELLGTLVDDYPDVPAYRNSLAALVNNQALALAGVNRHADALALYDTALELERECFERYGRTPSLRSMLSKMYFNQAQSQTALGRWPDAAATALRRRALWQEDAERLVGVAAELAEIARGWQASTGDSADASQRSRIEDEVVATLDRAREHGLPSQVDLTSDERFASLRDHKRFAELLAKVSRTTDGGGEQ